jgi:small multidrug resistance family-3 protein
MKTLALYVAAAVAEIGGCFAIWAVTRNGAPATWLAPGAFLLILFGWLLTLVDVDSAGRAYAIYGGICIAASSKPMLLIVGT